MGCDIHSFAEKRVDGKWEKVGEVFPTDSYARDVLGRPYTDSPFDWRNYGLYGFLANVRNYSKVPTIAAPRGLPDDACAEVANAYAGDIWDWHSASWLTVRELLDFDYDRVFEDRRITEWVAPNLWDGGAQADESDGRRTSIRDFLGVYFFRDLGILTQLGPAEGVRVVFWFDN